MAQTKKRRSSRSTASNQQELDGMYLLKLTMYVVIGTLWLRFTNPSGTVQIPIPIGLILGLIFAAHDYFRVDRKIEYAVLLIAMLVGFWAQAGLLVRW
jgi:hypothetical protein